MEYSKNNCDKIMLSDLSEYWVKLGYKTLTARNQRIPINIKQKIRKLDKNETKEIIELLNKIDHKKAGKTNQEKWENGWSQNLRMANKGIELETALVPCYFNKYPLHRILGEFYIEENRELKDIMSLLEKPIYDMKQEIRSESIENSLYRYMIKYFVFESIREYCSRCEKEELTIVDMGCGSGHNIFQLSKYLEEQKIQARIIGTDWSETSGLIIEKINSQTIQEVCYERFDYFEEETWKSLEKYNIDIIYSIASLEQFPGDIGKLMEFITRLRVGKGIHIEPIPEVLSDSLREDQQSKMYMKKRDYLSGLPSCMHSLEMKNKEIKNVEIFRTGLGSAFIDGYTYIGWQK